MRAIYIFVLPVFACAVRGRYNGNASYLCPEGRFRSGFFMLSVLTKIEIGIGWAWRHQDINCMGQSGSTKECGPNLSFHDFEGICEAVKKPWD